MPDSDPDPLEPARPPLGKEASRRDSGARTSALPVGAVLVGGGSRRFGSDKAVAELHGTCLAERASRTLAGRADPVFLVGAEPELARRLDRPAVPDRRPGKGPLAGVEAALLEALDLGRAGALVLACDMPLVPPRLFAAIVREVGGWDAVLPESPGPLGVEPLSGYYAVSALDSVQEVLDGSEPSMRALLSRLATRRIPPASFAGGREGETIFLNVNTPTDLDRARSFLTTEEG